MNEHELLTRYAVEKDQEAFRQLVRLHMDWVYGCARRMVHDPASADDVAQAVFILLARKAEQLRRETHIAGWLFRATRYCAAEAMRGKARRLKHEREAAMLRNEMMPEANWEEIRPIVDEAVAALGSTDRDAVLLRFFRGMSLEEVGQAMGMSEEAAKKRVQRAVVKLRELLARRGVSTSAGALGGVLALNLGEHAPAALVDAAVQAATGVGAAGGSALGLAKGAQTLFMIAKVKAAAAVMAVSAVAVSASAVAVVHATTPPARPATQPVAVVSDAASPAAVPEPSDPMYEKARRSSPDLEITAGSNPFRVTGVVRWNGEQMVASDGRGGTWNADPAVLKQIQGPRYASEDVAVVFLDTPPERFDVRRLRVFDHDRRQHLPSAAITRIPGTSAFRISHWFAPLPPRIDFWMDLASHAADSVPVTLEPEAGASAKVGETTVRVREIRDGYWSYRSTQNQSMPWQIEWGQPQDQGERVTIVLDYIGAGQAGRYQMSAVTASGHKVMSDFFEDFRFATTIRDLPVGLEGLRGIELRPFARPGPFFFDGIAMPQRTAPVESFASPPPVPIEGQWEVVLNSGPRVGVLGVADADRLDVWWAPDGEPTEKPSLPQCNNAWVSADGKDMRRMFCLRIAGLPASGDSHIHIVGASGWAGMGTGELMFLTAPLPKELATTTVQMGVSTQPWKIIEEFPLAQTGWLKAVPIYVRSVRQDGAKAQVVMDFAGLPDGMEMEYIGGDGKMRRHNSMSSRNDEASESGLPQRVQVGFENVPGGLKTLRIKWRPIEYVQVKDVRLNPK